MKAVLRMTGLTADTLRAWERRHHAVSPRRTPTGRRIYSRVEVERLKLLTALVRAGRSISSIAALTDDALIAIINSVSFGSGSSGRSGELLTDFNFEVQVGDLLRELRAFNLKEFQVLLQQLRFEMSPRTFLLQLFPQLMLQLGIQYEEGKISIAQEHAASEIFGDILRKIYGDLQLVGETKKETILFATTEGELHEFGLITAAILCRHKGFNTVYLGPNIPLESILLASERLKPSVLVLSTPWLEGVDNLSLENYLKELDSKLFKECNIWLGGGPSVQKLKRSGLRKALWVFETMLDLTNKLEQL